MSAGLNWQAQRPPWAPGSRRKLELTLEQSQSLIVRGQRGDPADCDRCILCGRYGSPLPVEHRCNPGLNVASEELLDDPPALCKALLARHQVQAEAWALERHRVEVEEWALDPRPQFYQDFWPKRPPAPSRTTVTAAQGHSGPPAARVEGLLRTVGSAQEGQRNQVLHWASCRVGEMLATGELPDPRMAASALEVVAQHAGLTAGETRATIRSGFSKCGVSV